MILQPENIKSVTVSIFFPSICHEMIGCYDLSFLHDEFFASFLVTQLVKNPSAMQETWVPSLGGEDPLEKGKATHSSILAWRIPRPIQSFSYTVGEGNGSPLQYSSLENPRDGG